MPLSRFFFENLLQRHQVGSAEGKAALKAQAQPMIAQIQGDNQRQLLEEELSRHMGDHDRHKLKTDILEANRRQKPAQADFKTPSKTKVSPIRMMIRQLLDTPELAKQCPDADPRLLGALHVSGLPLLQEVFAQCESVTNTAQLLERFRDHPQQVHLSKLLAWDPEVSEDKVQTVFRDSFARLLEWHLKSRMDELLSKSRVTSLSDEEKQELILLTKEQSTS